MPSWFRRFLFWEKQMDSELRFHFESLVADYERQGLSRSDAYRRARIDFGPVDLAKEECRDGRMRQLVEQTWSDGIYSLRCLAKSPAYSLLILATLALGIGANVAVFSVVKAVLLNQLPYRDPARLVVLGELDPPATSSDSIGYTTAYDWRRLSKSFERMSLYRDSSGPFTRDDGAELWHGLRVNYDFFDTLGVKMQLGRTFLPEEDHSETRYEIILNDGLWRRQFGADPKILGRAVVLGGTAFKVVGVLPPDFRLVDIPRWAGNPEFFQPLGYDLSQPYACRDCQHLGLIGRYRIGVSAAQAHAELSAIMANMAKQYPNSYRPGADVAFQPLLDHLAGGVRTAMWVSLGAVGMVLLVACANVANLILARAIGRSREVALRTALGASRSRLIRQLLTESLIVSLAGGALGVALAFAGVHALVVAGPREIPRLDEARIDWGTLIFAVGATVITALLAGLAPALRAAAPGGGAALQQTNRSTEMRGHLRLRGFTVAVELALAFALVTGGGLLGKSLIRLMNVDLGFEPANLLTVHTYVYGKRYQAPAAELAYYADVKQRLLATRGIQAVAMTSLFPLDSYDRRGLHIRDRHLRTTAEAPSADTYSVSAGYFRTMRIPILRGRGFLDTDGPDTPRVAIVSEACARQQFPNEDPIGKQVQLGGRDDAKPWWTIVGIAGDVRQHGLDTPPSIAAYLLQSQDASFGYSLVARTAGDPEAYERTVREAFAAADPTLPIFDLRPMESYLASSLAPRKFTLALVGLFAGLALLLAAIGIYGVIAYSAGMRTREYGVRIALGARRGDVFRSALRTCAAPVAGGLAAGIALAFGFSRFLTSLLFEAPAADPEVWGMVAALFVAVAFCASYAPARRAARIDPAISLRHE